MLLKGSAGICRQAGRARKGPARGGGLYLPLKRNDYTVVRVMALPQRGHWAEQEAQVVPQAEQVEQLWPRLLTQEPLYMVQLQDEEAAPFPFALPPADSEVQADCGKRGSEKNSSHTFSANSSHGGMAQKP